jgi:hypothetical protein
MIGTGILVDELIARITESNEGQAALSMTWRDSAD